MAIVTVEDYRRITGDTTTDSITIGARLEEAVDLVEEFLRRKLRHGIYTETLRAWYSTVAAWSELLPTAVPVTSVSTPGVAVSPRNSHKLRVVGSVLPTPVIDFSGSNEVTVTYEGGFTVDTLPATLARGIVRIAYGLGRTLSSQVAAGAGRVSVGDVTIEYPKADAAGAALDALAPGVARSLRSYRLRRLHQ